LHPLQQHKLPHKPCESVKPQPCLVTAVAWTCQMPT
jgi:hypothetical protein